MTKIHVLVPSYNCGRWIERCLQSVAEQKTQPAQVLVIDDASHDGSSELVFDAAIHRGYSFLRNSDNKKCPYNIWHGIQILDPADEDVIFLLDGDDFLPHNEVFDRFQQIYAERRTWLTYGNYEPHPHNTGQVPAAAYAPDVIQNRTFRTAGNYFNHPLTFRRFLFDAIDKKDLQNSSGEWFRGGYDFAIMAPMLEMCGGNHYRFIDENLYTYNAENMISDTRVNMHLIRETDELLYRPKKDLLQR